MNIDQLNKALKYGTGHTHADFLSQIAANPDDAHAPLIYADWLAENGLPGAEKVVRDWQDRKGWERPTKVMYHAPVPAYSHHSNDAPAHHPVVEIWSTSLDRHTGEHNYIVKVSAKDDYHTDKPQMAYGWFGMYAPEEAHGLVSGMGDMPGATQAKTELENRFRWLKKGGE